MKNVGWSSGDTIALKIYKLWDIEFNEQTKENVL